MQGINLQELFQITAEFSYTVQMIKGFNNKVLLRSRFRIPSCNEHILVERGIYIKYLFILFILASRLK